MLPRSSGKNFNLNSPKFSPSALSFPHSSFHHLFSVLLIDLPTSSLAWLQSVFPTAAQSFKCQRNHVIPSHKTLQSPVIVLKIETKVFWVVHGLCRAGPCLPLSLISHYPLLAHPRQSHQRLAVTGSTGFCFHPLHTWPPSPGSLFRTHRPAAAPLLLWGQIPVPAPCAFPLWSLS